MAVFFYHTGADFGILVLSRYALMKGCALPVLDSIIFDMDGLLIDTEIISYQLYSALLAPYGFTVSCTITPRLTAARPRRKT